MAEIPASTQASIGALGRSGAPSYNFTVADPALQARFGCPMQAFLQRDNETTTSITDLGPVRPDCVATGAVVFNASRTAMLLLQRSFSDSMPGQWETPGGGVDDDDATVLHAVARELWEETGLQAKTIRRCVPCRPGDGDDALTQAFVTRRGKNVVKFNFIVDVEDDGVVELDPREHQNFVWATEEECVRGATENERLRITTNEQQEVILNAWRIVGGL